MKWKCYRPELCLPVFAILIQFVHASLADLSEILSEPAPENFLLCRACGNDIGITKQLIQGKVSPFAKTSANESLFDQSQVLVQELVNPHGIRFQVVLLEQAECIANVHDKWVGDESSWFAGFAWKSCHCPRCGAHLGWMFEPAENTTQENLLAPTKHGFYAITVTGIVDENFVDSLLMREKIFRH